MRATVLIAGLVGLAAGEAGVLALHRTWLEMAGFRVLEFPAGLREAGPPAGLKPDVVVMDLPASGPPGWDLLDRVAGRVPVVVVAGHGDRTAAARALARGASCAVTTPFLPSELVLALDAAMAAEAQSRFAHDRWVTG